MNIANGVDVIVDANTPRMRSGDNLDGAFHGNLASSFVRGSAARPEAKPFVHRRGRSVSTWLACSGEVYIELVGDGQLLSLRASERRNRVWTRWLPASGWQLTMRAIDTG
jgi:hypothetical protein